MRILNYQAFISALASVAFLATGAVANDGIPEWYFTNNNGFAAAQAASPAWHMASGSCMPSAAEDGQGHQTNGVDPDNCNIGKLSHGCPVQPQWRGPKTYYNNRPGEPFFDIPTYYKTQKCGDNTWRVIYYVYFKKDTGHKSDWEGAVVLFKNYNGQWYRDSAILEQDGRHPKLTWGDINDTFQGTNDQGNYGQKYLNHPKFYFGKWHHSVHDDWHTGTFKNSCPPDSTNDFRNDDYWFWSQYNLRHTSVLNPNWKWGRATSPANIDLCRY